MQNKTDTFVNSVDPAESARSEPSHHDLHHLLFCVFDFLTEIPFVSKFRNGRVHLRKSR